MNFGLIHIVFLGVCLHLLASCNPTPEEKYLKMEAQELASNVRCDGLFKGLYLGMPDSLFFDFCLNKNIKKDFFQGGQKNSAWICTKMKGNGNKPFEINFFPTFKANKIAELEAAFYYDYATDSKIKLNSKDLLKDVLSMLENWYGRSFTQIKSPYSFKNDIFISIRGNRRIIVSEDTIGNFINVRFVDFNSTKTGSTITTGIVREDTDNGNYGPPLHVSPQATFVPYKSTKNQKTIINEGFIIHFYYAWFLRLSSTKR